MAKDKSTTPRRREPQPPSTAPDHRIIRSALRLLEARAREPGVLLNDPDVVGNWFRLRMAEYQREVFAVAWVDMGHRLIGCYELSFGTLDSTVVPAREVVISALSCNAAFGIFAHNHPSGRTDPSSADIDVTASLEAALAQVGVGVLDHFIVTATEPPPSMARNNMLPAGSAGWLGLHRYRVRMAQAMDDADDE